MHLIGGRTALWNSRANKKPVTYLSTTASLAAVITYPEDNRQAGRQAALSASCSAVQCSRSKAPHVSAPRAKRERPAEAKRTIGGIRLASRETRDQVTPAGTALCGLWSAASCRMKELDDPGAKCGGSAGNLRQDRSGAHGGGGASPPSPSWSPKIGRNSPSIRLQSHLPQKHRRLRQKVPRLVKTQPVRLRITHRIPHRIVKRLPRVTILRRNPQLIHRLLLRLR